MTSLPAWNTVFKFLDNPDDSVSDPVLQSLGNGSFAVVWSQSDPVTGEGRLWMRILGADGTPKTEATEITLAAGVATQAKFEPAVALLSNGNFVVTWEDYSNLDDDDVVGVRGKIFDANGVGIGDDFHINSKLEGPQFEASVTALAGGGFAVAYSDVSGDGDGSGVRTRIFDEMGRPVLRPGEDPDAIDDIFANAIKTRGQVNPATAALKDGGYVVVYEDYSVSGDDPYTTLRGRIFKADGTPVSENDFLIPQAGASGGKGYPDVVTLADGKFVAVWEYDKDDSGYKTVRGRVFNADGTPAGDEFDMHQGEDSLQLSPRIVALKDGGFAISYSTGAAGDVRIATFSGTGVFQANTLVELPENASLEGDPSIAVLADGRLVVSWVDHDVDTDTYGAHAQIFDPRSGAVNLPGTSQDDHYIGTGLNDILSGFTGNDKLEGGAGNDIFDGGLGADILIGGTGNDTYYIDNGDTVIEEGGGGYDIIIASYSAALGNNTQVEVLQAAAGTVGYSLSGGNMNDTLIGNRGHNVLNGGTGNDRMIGGAGNDIYYVNSRYDVVSETGSANGNDLVVSYVNYTLGAYVERLTGIGSSAISLTGNSLANTIIGNTAANVIKAGSGNDKIYGGYGNDLLYGNTGRDIFVFNTALHSARNKDRVLDWVTRDDTIYLENAIFKALKKTGTLNKAYFTVGAKATDKYDFIGYNKATGDLWYDVNANRSGGQYFFANVGKNKGLTNADFVII
ncbi:calcium-binding protein [Microvirga solisilvae]|uniref:calcium-binding protein n=1 Tax=Microvirga solisilvae TaxID=2919498 RepID=UPI001FAF0F64|nr:calcium-binding protein [Microvirga solisilvae]